MATDETETVQTAAHVGSERETVTIEEWSSSPPLVLSDADLAFIEQQINDSRQRLSISYTSDRRVVVGSSRFVGIVALPDGPTIEIVPKSAGENFIRLFRYAQGLESHTIQNDVDVRSGAQFLDALAALYVSELATILQRGIAKEYRRSTAREDYVRGQINVQRQFQRPGVAATQFDCTYDELTPDTPVNQALLYATIVLKRLVRDAGLHQKLEQYETQFRRMVTARHVAPHEVTSIEVTRLNDYYRDALRLAELIIQNIYVENLRQGDRGSFGLLLNMDSLFEAVVERAVRDAVQQSPEWQGWSVEGQANVTGLVTGGSPQVTMRPDFVVRDTTGTVVFTGDAKWKTNGVRQADIYQLTAYQLADDVPGVLIHPQQQGHIETEYTVRDEFPLAVHELPTARPVSDFETFRTRLEQSTETLLRDLLNRV